MWLDNYIYVTLYSRYTFLTRLCKYIHSKVGYLDGLITLPETPDAGSVCKKRKVACEKKEGTLNGGQEVVQVHLNAESTCAVS